jgi:hypothetical protein
MREQQQDEPGTNAHSTQLPHNTAGRHYVVSKHESIAGAPGL